MQNRQSGSRSHGSHGESAKIQGRHVAPNAPVGNNDGFGRERRAQRERRNGVLRTALLMLVAVAIGIAIGVFVYPLIPFPGTRAALPGRMTVSEAECIRSHRIYKKLISYENTRNTTIDIVLFMKLFRWNMKRVLNLIYGKKS